MTFLVVVVILFIVFAAIGFSNAEKEKQKEAERQAKQGELRKQEEEKRKIILDEVISTRDRDFQNATLYENSTLGRYTFRVKGLIYRSEENQAGAKLLRMYSPLSLVHEDNNEYDPYAMCVFSETGGFFLGYVEREMSKALCAVKDNIKACMITYYSYGIDVPYISATAYFQKEKHGVLQPYTLDAKKVDMPSEINLDNTVQNYRSYISKALKKADWNERTFNEVQARTDFLLSNGVKISERIKEELRARGIKVKDIEVF